MSEPDSLGRYMGLEVPETLEELLVRYRAGDKIPIPNWQLNSNDEHGRVMGTMFLEYAGHAVRTKVTPADALEFAAKLQRYVQVSDEKLVRAVPMPVVLSFLAERCKLPIDPHVITENLRTMAAADVDFMDMIELVAFVSICVAWGYREGLAQCGAAMRESQIKIGAPATFNPIAIVSSRKP